MNYALWSDIFRVIAIIGSFVTVLATIGHFVTGKAADRAKAAQIKELETSNRTLQTKVSALDQYSDVSRLNFRGKPFADGDIVFSSPLSRLMDGTYHGDGDTLSFNRTPETEAQLRKVIEAYPDFPFAHYGLAVCMRERGDPEWKQEMIRARDIFRITTTLPGHHEEHDDALRRIERILSE